MSVCKAKSGRWGLECDLPMCGNRFWPQGRTDNVDAMHLKARRQGWFIVEDEGHFCTICAPRVRPALDPEEGSRLDDAEVRP